MKTLAEQTYNELRSQIIKGKYQAGEFLRQRLVAKEFGIATITLRESLQRLEHDGLVEIVPKWGARVRFISDKVLKEKFIVREALESMAVRLATQMITDDEIKELYGIAEKVDNIVKSPEPSKEEFARTHYDFHLAVAKASHCEELVCEIERASLFYTFWISAMLVDIRLLKDYQYEHKIIVDAIAGRDPDKAVTQMVEHIRSGLKHSLSTGCK